MLSSPHLLNGSKQIGNGTGTADGRVVVYEWNGYDGVVTVIESNIKI